jgi:predicted dehydrogenase
MNGRPSRRPRRLSRRRFVGQAASAVSAFTIVPRFVLGGAGFVPPSEKVNIAIVGCGGQGRTNVRALFEQNDAQVIAVADPIETQNLEPFYYKGAAGRLPLQTEIQKHYAAKTPNFKVAAYEDFRVLLEKEKSVDAILCATPDHLHAYVSTVAMRLGKHVYCEKPLTHNVWEARQVARIAKETGLATQMGNQGHAGDFIRQTCELIWDGAVGDVDEVHAWTSATRWNKNLVTRPEDEATPQGVNWDLWLGPREPRGYSAALNPVRWRDFWDFGTAPIGDFFCHNFDPACWALDLREPLSIEASPVGALDATLAPPAGIYTYRFPSRDTKPPVKFTWYEGGLKPPRPEGMAETEAFDGNGILFIGNKGALSSPGWGGRPKLHPAAKDKTYPRPAPRLARSKGHHREWLDACKGGPSPASNFGYGAALTEVGLLGLVAMRLGKKLLWNAAAMACPNVPEAAQYLKESYRPGWELPG